MCKKASIYGQNHIVEELPNSERYSTLSTKEYLSGVILKELNISFSHSAIYIVLVFENDMHIS